MNSIPNPTVHGWSPIDPFESVASATQEFSHRDLTLKEALAKTDQIYAHCLPTFKAASIATLQYLDRMSGLLSVNMDTCKVFQVFKDPTSSSDRALMEDRNEINKLLIAIEKQAQSEVPEELKVADLALIKSMEKSLIDRREYLVREIEDKISRHTSDARTYYSRFVDQHKAAWLQRKTLVIIQDQTEGFLREEIEKIYKSSFWKVTGIYGGRMELVTRNDVTMSQRNTAAGVNMQVNFGKYGAHLHLNDGYITVLKHEKNITVNRFYHTYIDEGGSICWGNGSGIAQEYLTNGQFSDALDLLASVLTNYSPDSTPWMGLDRFYASQQSGGTTTYMPPPEEDLERCETCEEILDECHCWTCESCEERYTEAESCESCCSNCENSNDDCTCCGICGSRDNDECDCCQECERSDSSCTRCRECGEHDGEHTNGCSENIPEEEMP